jgi:hypothetical protein
LAGKDEGENVGIMRRKGSRKGQETENEDKNKTLGNGGKYLQFVRESCEIQTCALCRNCSFKIKVGGAYIYQYIFKMS